MVISFPLAVRSTSVRCRDVKHLQPWNYETGREARHSLDQVQPRYDFDDCHDLCVTVNIGKRMKLDNRSCSIR
jgi:hypothetical protein